MCAGALRHPLAGQVSIGSKALEAYPHVTYSDEDITKINYCSDIFQYNQNVVEKRIIVQDRGTLLQVIGERTVIIWAAIGAITIWGHAEYPIYSTERYQPDHQNILDSTGRVCAYAAGTILYRDIEAILSHAGLIYL